MSTQAERRRTALKKFMNAHNLSRGALAREAGLTPNIVYNFMAGRTSYLSQPTLEKIAKALGVATAAITGEDLAAVSAAPASPSFGEPSQAYALPAKSSLSLGMSALQVQGVLMGTGIWSDFIFAEPEGEEYVSFALPFLYADKAFAVKARRSAEDALPPHNAILGCVPAGDYLQLLGNSDLVVTVRQNSIGLFETTLRSYRIDGSRHFLVLQGKEIQSKDTLELQAPLHDPLAVGIQDFFIHSIVLAYIASLPAARR